MGGSSLLVRWMLSAKDAMLSSWNVAFQQTTIMVYSSILILIKQTEKGLFSSYSGITLSKWNNAAHKKKKK